ncbi:hypothetical protein LOS01_11380 [Proteus mirabilis]|uniref:hypothetical protein n=1 Tax=Proteus mirabilis TaxID=584 RepID=UPI001E3FBDB2|nr:hypothetical protein [Proteus mirabilis]MCD4624364.1 hypothetical protein [Proteus mirabilis]
MFFTFEEKFGVGFLSDIMQYLNEIEVEYETEISAYSQLRKRSKETYELTKTFSGTGYYFYLKRCKLYLTILVCCELYKYLHYAQTELFL